ncbi:MAG: ABC transporter permease [Cyclobacteriaceae bacterium]
MLKNYFIVALRNIINNKGYSVINIAGLSLGVTCCLLLLLYIQDEMTYDKHHPDLNNIYRVNTYFESERGSDALAATSPPVAMTMVREIPEVETAVRVLNAPGVSKSLIKYGNKVFYENNGLIADSTLFDVLGYRLIHGTPGEALTKPNTVVLTETLSRKLFGEGSPIGESIEIGRGVTPFSKGPITFKVTGVVAEDEKSHIKASFFTSMLSKGWAEFLRSDMANGEWAGQNFVPAYLKLQAGHDPDVVERKLNEVLQKYGAEDLKAMGMTKELKIEPVKDIYLRSDVGQSPRITYIYVIASIALFILLLACINFMNLSTAKASKRAGEIGIRKVMGAVRSSLAIQVLGEAMAIVVFSMLISIVLLIVALPYFNQLTGKSISFWEDGAAFSAIAILIITIFTGLIAGSYPAFYLSSFQPAQALKGKFSASRSSNRLRKSLVVFQFMVAIILVSSMILTTRQLSFMLEKDPGFKPEAKIIIPLQTNAAKQRYAVLRDELTKNSSVINVSGANYAPGSNIVSDKLFYKEGSNMEAAVLNQRNVVENDYLELMEINLLAGQSFNSLNGVDNDNRVIINETSARSLGFSPEEAVNKKLYTEWQGQKSDFRIIGVVEDFHQVSLKEEIKPIMFQLAGPNTIIDHMIVEVNSDQYAQVLNFIQNKWNNLISDTPFEYSILDEDIRQLYAEDNNVANIIRIFTFIAIFISCLGLYGLSTYTAERRFKEIGIRKVLGASVPQVLGMMSKEFGILVLIAFLISVPISWYAMNSWLEGFAYHVSIEVSIFLYSGLGALLLALIIISYESLKAASVNPIKSNRHE